MLYEIASRQAEEQNLYDIQQTVIVIDWETTRAKASTESEEKLYHQKRCIVTLIAIDSLLGGENGGIPRRRRVVLGWRGEWLQYDKERPIRQ